MNVITTNYDEHIYCTNNSQLHIYNHYNNNEIRNHAYDNVVFAMMHKGKKAIWRDNHTEEIVLEHNLILANESLKVTSKCIDATEVSSCIVLEISKTKVKNILNKIQFDNENSNGIPNTTFSSEMINFENISSQSLRPVFMKLSNLYLNESKFKDYYIETMIDELILESLQNDKWCGLLLNLDLEKNINPLGFVVEYIKSNIHENFDMNSLAKKACMSRSSFFKKFKEVYGKSPISFINETKINKSCELMIQSNKSIAEISFSLGFSSPSYFVYLFHSLQNLTPAAYRAKAIERGINSQY
jgi:AraC family transcriptional regulator